MKKDNYSFKKLCIDIKAFRMLITFGFFSDQTIAQVTTCNINNGLVGNWKFDDDLSDFSTIANPAAIYKIKA